MSDLIHKLDHFIKLRRRFQWIITLRSHVRNDAQTKMQSDFCMLLRNALHLAVNETRQFMRL